MTYPLTGGEPGPAATAGIGLRRTLRRLCAASLCLLACPALAERLPVEYFTKEDNFGELKISPDGEYVAATTGGTGKSALVFLALDDDEVAAGIRAREQDVIGDFHWASDKRVVFSYRAQLSAQGRESGTGQLFAIDRDGKRHLLLYGTGTGEASRGTRARGYEASDAAGELLSVLEDDDRSILILERPVPGGLPMSHHDTDALPRFSRLNVYSGKKRELGVVPLAASDVVVDQQGQVRLAIGHDTKGMQSAAWRRNPDDDWTTFAIEGFRTNTIVPHRLTADGSGVVFTAVETGASLEGLYRLDLTLPPDLHQIFDQAPAPECASKQTP